MPRRKAKPVVKPEAVQTDERLLPEELDNGAILSNLGGDVKFAVRAIPGHTGTFGERQYNVFYGTDLSLKSGQVWTRDELQEKGCYVVGMKPKAIRVNPVWLHTKKNKKKDKPNAKTKGKAKVNNKKVPKNVHKGSNRVRRGGGVKRRRGPGKV